MNTQTVSSGKSRAFRNALDARPETATRTTTQSFDGRNEVKEVNFELDASLAKEVLLAGDFTGWEKTPIRLRKAERGAWRTTVKLPPGQYRYKFLVDGQWRDDPRAAARCPNPFGSCDSLVAIS
ncbi:MAG: glycogen-binding domain-containing protein [Verrucomicrobiota bacterium]|jgi:1,4-alpha-glucan branching enzyme